LDGNLSSNHSSFDHSSSSLSSDNDEEVFHSALDGVDQAESDLCYKQIAKA